MGTPESPLPEFVPQEPTKEQKSQGEEHEPLLPQNWTEVGDLTELQLAEIKHMLLPLLVFRKGSAHSPAVIRYTGKHILFSELSKYGFHIRPSSTDAAAENEGLLELVTEQSSWFSTIGEMTVLERYLIEEIIAGHPDVSTLLYDLLLTKGEGIQPEAFSLASSLLDQLFYPFPKYDNASSFQTLSQELEELVTFDQKSSEDSFHSYEAGYVSHVLMLLKSHITLSIHSLADHVVNSLDSDEDIKNRVEKIYDREIKIIRDDIKEIGIEHDTLKDLGELFDSHHRSIYLKAYQAVLLEISLRHCSYHAEVIEVFRNIINQPLWPQIHAQETPLMKPKDHDHKDKDGA
ncbi:MAG: hypothetical protein Q8O95_00650 [bacterium]|nr:hypothetical protein [bacterium]